MSTLRPSVDDGYMHSLVADEHGGVSFAIGHGYIETISANDKVSTTTLPEDASVARIALSDASIWFVGGQGTESRLGLINAAGIRLISIPRSDAQMRYTSALDVFPDPAGLAATPNGPVWFTELQGRAIVSYFRGSFQVFPLPGRPGNVIAIDRYSAVTSNGSGVFWIAQSDGSVRRLAYPDIEGNIYFARDSSGIWIAGSNVVARLSRGEQIHKWKISGLESVSIASYADEAYVLARDATGRSFMVLVPRDGPIRRYRIPAPLGYDSEIAVDGQGTIWLLTNQPKALIRLKEAGVRHPAT